jgi:hypothetical protein
MWAAVRVRLESIPGPSSGNQMVATLLGDLYDMTQTNTPAQMLLQLTSSATQASTDPIVI